MARLYRPSNAGATKKDQSSVSDADRRIPTLESTDKAGNLLPSGSASETDGRFNLFSKIKRTLNDVDKIRNKNNTEMHSVCRYNPSDKQQF